MNQRAEDIADEIIQEFETFLKGKNKGELFTDEDQGYSLQRAELHRVFRDMVVEIIEGRK